MSNPVLRETTLLETWLKTPPFTTAMICIHARLSEDIAIWSVSADLR